MKKFPAFIALLCILVYVAALLYGAYRVYTNIETQKQRAIAELDGIQRQITQSGSSFFTESFREDIKKRLAGCDTLQGIIVTGSQGSIPFEKEAGSVIRHDPAPGFIPRFGYKSLPAREADIPNIRNVYIHSFYNALDYGDLVSALRLILVGILGALLVSFLTMMITLLRSRSGRVASTQFAGASSDSGQMGYGDTFSEYSGNSDAAPDTGSAFSDVFDETDGQSGGGFSADDDFTGVGDFSDSGDFSTPVEEGPGLDAGGDDFELPDFDDFSGMDAAVSGDDDFHLDDFLDEEDLSLPTAASATASVSAATSAAPSTSSQAPNGLYSPRSNLGWEAYTVDRLASELHRCASSEQDLVVLLMECGDGINCDARLYKKIADEAVEIFNLHDLTFEHGNTGITVIIPNAGLEQGIAKAESFHSRLINSHYESFHSNTDFLIGISSRSGRLIEADRLLLEAKTALEKAKIDAGSPIVAFKSDPEKYREFVRKSALQD